MEQKNPYTGLLEIMGESAKGAKTIACLIGSVSSAVPLKVRAGGLEIDADAIMINPILRSNYKRRASFGGSQEDLTFTQNELQEGDMVLLIPGADLQTFYLVCRLEAADG